MSSKNKNFFKDPREKVLSAFEYHSDRFEGEYLDVFTEFSVTLINYSDKNKLWYKSAPGYTDCLPYMAYWIYEQALENLYFSETKPLPPVISDIETFFNFICEWVEYNSDYYYQRYFLPEDARITMSYEILEEVTKIFKNDEE